MSTIREKIDEIKESPDPRRALLALIECGEFTDQRRNIKYGIDESGARPLAYAQGGDGNVAATSQYDLIRWLMGQIAPDVMVDSKRLPDAECSFCGARIVTPTPCEHYVANRIERLHGGTLALFAWFLTEAPQIVCEQCSTYNDESNDHCWNCGDNPAEAVRK
ncbi:MAG: hypothetical protein ACREJC_09690 [Tepidisphaeraceae bacterium]